MTRKEGIQFMPILRAYINDEQLQWRHKHTDEKMERFEKKMKNYTFLVTFGSIVLKK